MNRENTIIKDKNEYKKFNALVQEVFNVEQCFPKQVFSNTYSRFMFEEFDWAMSIDFWNTVQELGRSSLDSHILMAVIDPSPNEYFYKEFGYYNWFKLPTTISPDDYWSILELEPEGSPTDALLFNSEVVVWVSPSKRWAIWGERSFGICVLAITDTFDELPIEPWLSVGEALKGIVSQNFENQKVPKDFSDLLKVNYRNKS